MQFGISLSGLLPARLRSTSSGSIGIEFYRTGTHLSLVPRQRGPCDRQAGPGEQESVATTSTRFAIRRRRLRPRVRLPRELMSPPRRRRPCHTKSKPLHPVSVTRGIRVVDRTLRPQPITGQRTPHSRYALILRLISSPDATDSTPHHAQAQHAA